MRGARAGATAGGDRPASFWPRGRTRVPEPTRASR